MNSQEVSAQQREREESLIRSLLNISGANEIVYEDEGWDSRVYLVNDGEAVFKFPRSPGVKEQYRHEIAALQMLEGLHGPVATPRVRWSAPDLSYFGYEGIVGESLSRRLHDLDQPSRQQIGTSLGQFVRLLQSAELKDARSINVDDEVAEYAEKYRLARPALAAEFTDTEMRAVEDFFLDQLPKEMRRLGSELRLSHGDLGPWNIIVSSGGGLGVIDFGEVGYRDASKDFSGFGDDTILKAALDAYGADEHLREKIVLRIKAFPVLDVPFYLGKHDAAGVQACLDLIKSVIIRDEPAIDARFKRD